MALTEEQKSIVSSSGNIKINAVAGSGKTSTLIAYAKERSKLRRILYLAFNRSVRLDAQRRFADAGVTNVDVQTAHSLAFRRIMAGSAYTVAANGYRAHDLRELLELRASSRDPHAAHAIATHIGRFAGLFCNHATRKVEELSYPDTVEDAKAKAFVRRNLNTIISGTRLFLAKMDRAEIPVTHEFYLKKFQLSNPDLNADCILFDEGQDASPVMLDVFLAQPCTRVIVGDGHQQIYGWRWAINALAKVDFADFSLTTSFRFGPAIASLALECLRWKRHFGDEPVVEIVGRGGTRPPKTSATIARTNLALLKNAIGAVSRKRGLKKLYFEGNLNSYTYAAEGASIYDVLNLYVDKKESIRSPLIASMQGFAELEEYADVAEDVELSMLIDLVKEYERDLPRLLRQVKECHVADEDRSKADMIFSTVHRCKGMEYGHVTLESDFVNEARIVKTIAREGLAGLNLDKLAEEVNLAYVAVTRTAGTLAVPQAMFPGREPQPSLKQPEQPPAKELSGWLFKQRSKHGNAYKPWSKDDDRILLKLADEGATSKVLAARFDRRPSAIRARLEKLRDS